jgi:hypothetical protein
MIIKLVYKYEWHLALHALNIRSCNLTINGLHNYMLFLGLCF